MDLSPFFGQMFNMVILVGAVTIVLGFLKSPRFKGFVGELMVNVGAVLMLDKHQYRIIKDVTLPVDDGTTQIDQIVVSEFGVFVVETKNMKGWIFGSADQPMWTQKIFKHTNQFQNPLRQNYKHVKTLESLLSIDADKIHSVIVFVGDSSFKTPMPENVTHGIGYIRYIKSFNQKVLTSNEVESITREIRSGRLPATSVTKSEHIKNLKNPVNNISGNGLKCPKCGASMVMRTAKKGQYIGRQFWGCSLFPKCKGIIDID